MPLEMIPLHVLALISLVVPGYVAIRGITKKCPDLDSCDLFLLSIFVSFLLVSTVAFTLALIGLFQPLTVWTLCLTLSAIFYWRLKYEESSYKVIYRSPVSLIVGLALIALAYLSFGEPFEWMTFFNLDVGRYSNIASSILNSGGIKVRVADLPNISVLTKNEIFLPTQLYDSPPSSTEEISTSYLHLFPVILALFRAHAGIFSSFQINWLLLIFSAASFYLLLKLSLKCRVSALAGAALLFSSPVSQLYSYKTMAEMSCQFLVSVLFLLLFVADKTKDSRYLIFAGLTSFLLAACRLEFGLFFFVIPSFYLFLYLRGLCQRKEVQILLTTYCILTIPLAFYYFDYAKRYLHRNIINLIFSYNSHFDLNYRTLYFTDAGVYILVMLSPILIISISYWVVSRNFKLVLDLREKEARSKFLINNLLARVIQVSVILFLGWSFFIRPNFALATPPDRDAENLIRLLAFIDPITLCIGTLSIYSLLRNEKLTTLYTLVGIIIFALTLYKTNHLLPETRWIRRYAVVCVPTLYFLALASCMKLQRFVLLPYFIIAFLVNCSTSKLLTQFPEQTGLFKAFESYSKNFASSDLQLCANDKYCDQVATPVGSHFGIQTLNLQPNWNPRMEKFFASLKNYPNQIFLTEVKTDFKKSNYEKFIERLKNTGVKLQLIEENAIETTEYVWAINKQSHDLNVLDKYIYRTSFKPAFRTQKINFTLYKLQFPSE